MFGVVGHVLRAAHSDHDRVVRIASSSWIDGAPRGRISPARSALRQRRRKPDSSLAGGNRTPRFGLRTPIFTVMAWCNVRSPSECRLRIFCSRLSRSPKAIPTRCATKSPMPCSTRCWPRTPTPGSRSSRWRKPAWLCSPGDYQRRASRLREHRAQDGHWHRLWRYRDRLRRQDLRCADGYRAAVGRHFPGRHGLYFKNIIFFKKKKKII